MNKEFIKTIAESLFSEIKTHVSDFSKEDIESWVERPKDQKMGDWAFPCFRLAKSMKRKPPEIASLLVDKLQFESDKIESAQATGPYINFTLKMPYVAKKLIPAILDSSFLQNEPNKNQNMMIEFSQPNTHKAFHVGHTRNVALGDSVVQLNRFAGYNVISATYPGDVGTHVAKCLFYFLKFYDGKVPEEKLDNKAEFLGDMYSAGTDYLDFKLLTKAPHPGIVSAKVLQLSPHPNSEKNQIVELDTGSAKKTVVCGGKGFKTGDIVAYAPVGINFGGKKIAATEKQGISSEGFICGEKEISISDDRSKIFVFNSDVPLGQPITELLRKPDAVIECASIEEEMSRRTAEVQSILQRLEKKDPEIYELWRETRKWSLDEFDRIYDWLDTEFQEIFFESEVGDEGKEIVKKALDDGILIKSDGAIGADLSKFKLPFFMLLKSNGTGLYSTKDIALARTKFEKHNLEKSVYIVDDAQTLHFQQVFKTLELLGFEKAKNCYHLPYAQVGRASGKMSSRKGNVIYFSELKAKLLKKIREQFLYKYEDQWNEDELIDVAHKISVATIKYGMLNQDNNKFIAFELEEWTSQKGNTGPYLMYAYARIRSILRDADGDINSSDAPSKMASKTIDYGLLEHESEHRLIKSLLDFRDVAGRAAESFEPHALCLYLYDLSREFNQFYANCSVLKAETNDLRRARLFLAEATSLVLKKGLNLLGIKTVERM